MTLDFDKTFDKNSFSHHSNSSLNPTKSKTKKNHDDHFKLVFASFDHNSKFFHFRYSFNSDIDIASS